MYVGAPHFIHLSTLICTLLAGEHSGCQSVGLVAFYSFIVYLEKYMSEHSGELAVKERPTAVEIPTRNPADSQEKMVADGERKAEAEFNRESTHEEMRRLASGYEFAIRSIAEEADAKKRLEESKAEKPSDKRWFRFKKEKPEKSLSSEGLTENGEYEYTVRYHRDKQGIVPDGFRLSLAPYANGRGRPYLSIGFDDGRISALKFTYTLESALGESDRGNNTKREEILSEVPVPIVKKLEEGNVITSHQSSKLVRFFGKDIALKIGDEDGMLQNPMLSISYPYDNPDYNYDFNEKRFVKVRGSTKSTYPDSISESPADVMEQFLNLIPANKV